MHIFCYINESMTKEQHKVLIKYRKTLFQMSTPEVGMAIMAGVSSIAQEETADLYQRDFTASTTTRQAMESQKDIGWDQFLLGQIATRWQQIGLAPEYSWGGSECSL